MRNSSKYVYYKDLKALMADLKAVYVAVGTSRQPWTLWTPLESTGTRNAQKSPNLGEPTGPISESISSTPANVILLIRQQPGFSATALYKFCSIHNLNRVYIEFWIDPKKTVCTCIKHASRQFFLLWCILWP